MNAYTFFIVPIFFLIVLAFVFQGINSSYATNLQNNVNIAFGNQALLTTSPSVLPINGSSFITSFQSFDATHITIGEYITNQSKLVGQSFDRITVYLNQSIITTDGSLLQIGVFNNVGQQVKFCDYYRANAIVTTIGSWKPHVSLCPDGAYKIKAGDLIGVQYPSPTPRIDLASSTGDAFDGANSLTGYVDASKNFHTINNDIAIVLQLGGSVICGTVSTGPNVGCQLPLLNQGGNYISSISNPFAPLSYFVDLLSQTVNRVGAFISLISMIVFAPVSLTPLLGSTVLYFIYAPLWLMFLIGAFILFNPIGGAK